MKSKLLYVCLFLELLIAFLFFGILVKPLKVSALTNTTVESQIDTLNVIVSDEINEWSESDSEHIYDLKDTVSTSTLITTLISECGILEKACSELNKTAYVTKSNTLVYHPVTSVKISLIRNGIYQRQKLLNLLQKGETTQSYTYNTAQLVDILDINQYYISKSETNYSLKDMTSFFNDVVTILDSEMFSNGLTSGVKIYILPYMMEKRTSLSNSNYIFVSERIGGYASSMYTDGKEEVIVCSMSNMAYLIHEIGHVYFNEVLGTSFTPTVTGYYIHNTELWKKYLAIYPEVNFDLENFASKKWIDSIIENCAEDFKCFYSNKLKNITNLNTVTKKQLKSTCKFTTSEYKEADFLNFINSISDKKFNLNATFPTITMSLYNMGVADIYVNQNGYKKVTSDKELKIEFLDNDKSIMKIIYIIITGPDSAKQTINFVDNIVNINSEKPGTYIIDFVIQTPTGEEYIVNTQTITKI